MFKFKFDSFPLKNIFSAAINYILFYLQIKILTTEETKEMIYNKNENLNI